MANVGSKRYTRAQNAVLATLQQHRQPIFAQDLYRVMRSPHGIGLATIYRSLDTLQKWGLIQHRTTLGGTTLYSLVEHDHPYMTCLHCGQSFPINECPVMELTAKLQGCHAFKIYHHTLEFFGLCKPCAVRSG